MCDHRCLLMLLCTQDRRTGVAKPCSLLLYTGLDHTEPSASSGAAPCRRAASVLWATVHRGRLPRRSSGSSGQWSASCSRRAGGWRSGSMGPVYVLTTVRYRDLINAIERIYNALTRKPRYSAFCRIATRRTVECCYSKRWSLRNRLLGIRRRFWREFLVQY